MAKTTSDNYSTLHRLLFGVVGVALHRKKNIRRFNGYDFDKDSKQYEAKLAAMRFAHQTFNFILRFFQISIFLNCSN